ncbi:hypothetical protein [Corynebacterium aurimucosum]|uniref:hypothetical protein n=1 Tax=Corynebacterium aurimucosum TaxID=169292 RepID=UPI00187951D1|nr:hypothetical protein [Corynebacterium aurimucosum]MBE7338131.1 hypothetical protein [Corynebacterium aurimucosum]
MTTPYLVADSASVTILRSLASTAYGTYSLSVPEGVNIEDIYTFAAPGNEIGYVASLGSKRVGGMFRRFIRADVAVTAADASNPDWGPASDVDEKLQEAAERTSGDFFLESDITIVGLGPWVPFVDFDLGDLVHVEIWGQAVLLPVTRIEPIISDHDIVDWKVHVGGQLIDDNDAREAENATIYKALIEDRRNLAGLSSQVSKAVADSSKALAVATDADGQIQQSVKTAHDYSEESIAASKRSAEYSDKAAEFSQKVTDLQPTIEKYAVEAQQHSNESLRYSELSRVYSQTSAAQSAQSISFSEQSHQWSIESQKYSLTAAQASADSQTYSQQSSTYSQASQSASSKSSAYSASAKSASDAAVSAQGFSESAMKEAERQRGLAETARDDAEQSRSAAEGFRDQAEQKRSAAEGERAKAESARSAAEAARDEAELKRASAESSRAAAETARRDAEGERTKAEEARSRSFAAMTSASAQMAQAEAARAQAENERKNAELARAEAEDRRKMAEDARSAAESARDVAEQKRAAADTARQAAEVARDQTITDVSLQTWVANFRRVRQVMYDQDMPFVDSNKQFNDSLRWSDGTTLGTIRVVKANGQWTVYFKKVGSWSGDVEVSVMSNDSRFGAFTKTWDYTDTSEYALYLKSVVWERLFVKIYPQWPDTATRDAYQTMAKKYRAIM